MNDLTQTLALTLTPTPALTLTPTPTPALTLNPNHSPTPNEVNDPPNPPPNQVNDLHAIYLRRPKTHENMPPRTKTVNQQELRRWTTCP